MKGFFAQKPSPKRLADDDYFRHIVATGLDQLQKKVDPIVLQITTALNDSSVISRSPLLQQIANEVHGIAICSPNAETRLTFESVLTKLQKLYPGLSSIKPVSPDKAEILPSILQFTQILSEYKAAMDALYDFEFEI